MARTKSLICYPRLNDAKGDVNKRWYVEYAFRLPEDPEKVYRYRTYDGLCSGTAEDRYAHARDIIEERTQWLKSGAYLTEVRECTTPVKEVEDYRPEVSTYKSRLEQMRVRPLVEVFIMEVRRSREEATYNNYKGKLRLFCRYIEEQLHNCTVQHIRRPEVVEWLKQLADGDLCTVTLEKYMQILRAFFAWCIREGHYDERNPVYDIPKFGKTIDCAPVPLDAGDRQKLKLAIATKEPYLWLACEIQYYCAIRPGTELRLLKLKDIDRSRKMITIHSTNAKNGRTQHVAVPEHVLVQMDKLGVWAYDGELYLFGSTGIPGAQPLGKNTMRNRFNRYRTQLKISPDKKFYSWKHAGAIDAAEAGMPIMQLKDHLRHESLATTEAYLRKRKPSSPDTSKWLGEI